jgi:Ulp1 protease family, C-terminal catalytic domain
VPVVEHLHWSMAVIANLDTLPDRWQREESVVILTEIKAGAEDEGDGSLAAEASGDEGTMARTSRQSSAGAGAADGLKQRHTCIVFMDSLNMHSAGQVAANINLWLQNEWNTRGSAAATGRVKRFASIGENCSSGAAGTAFSSQVCGGSGASDFKVDSYSRWVAGTLADGLNLLKPKVPRQLNGCDCGVFSLQYAEEMLFRLPFITGADTKAQNITDFTPVMFTPDDMQVHRVVGWCVLNTFLRLHKSNFNFFSFVLTHHQSKRQSMKQLVESLHMEQDRTRRK